MYQRILNDPVVLPLNISEDAISLLDRLLRKNPRERLTANEIKRHRFLADVNWDELLQRKTAPPYELDPRVSHFDPEYTSMRISWSEGDDTHEGGQRSLSVVEFAEVNKGADKESGKDSDTTMIMVESGELELKERTKKKNKVDMCRLDMIDIHAKNWKVNFELFLGYPFTRESPPIQQQKAKVNMKATTAIKTGVLAAPSKSCTLMSKKRLEEEKGESTKKTFSIQAASLRGESNDPDILITDSDDHSGGDEECGKIGHPLGTGQSQQRCASVENLRKLGKCPRYVPHTRLVKNFPNPNEGPQPSQFAKAALAQYETCNLIKAQRSKVTAGIIKLNDELNGGVSERKRAPITKQNDPFVYIKPKPMNVKAKISFAKKAGERPIKPPLYGKTMTPATGFRRKKGMNTRNSNKSEDVSGWTVDTQLIGNESNFEQQVAALTVRRVSTNTSQSPSKNAAPKIKQPRKKKNSMWEFKVSCPAQIKKDFCSSTVDVNKKRMNNKITDHLILSLMVLICDHDTNRKIKIRVVNPRFLDEKLLQVVSSSCIIPSHFKTYRTSSETKSRPTRGPPKKAKSGNVSTFRKSHNTVQAAQATQPVIRPSGYKTSKFCMPPEKEKAKFPGASSFRVIPEKYPTAMGRKNLNLNIQGDLKVENHIIILPGFKDSIGELGKEI